MSLTKDELLQLAATAMEESDLLDFKREFSPEKKAAFWAETVKDIVAFANTRGGIIVFGIEDDGSDAANDCGELIDFDSASLCDQIKKYTNSNFSDISICKVYRSNKEYPAILIGEANIPLVFSKPGTYEYEPGRQKTAFSMGTVYFRHGSKSEPCTQDDLSRKIDRELSRIRQEWLGNIRKVVEAEPGSSVVVTNAAAPVSEGSLRITNDPKAPVARLTKLSDGYPHRQADVIALVNKNLRNKARINTHDIQAIKLFEEISHENTPEFIHKPHEKASPQYTDEFVNFICERYRKNVYYFEECRDYWKSQMY